MTLKPSALLLKWIILSHLLALVVVWFSALSVFWCLLADCLVVWSFIQQVQNHWTVGTRHLSFQEGRWWLQQDNSQMIVDLHGEYYFSPWIIILNFRGQESGKYSLVILPDSVEADELRRLRVFLKSLPQAIPE